MIEFELHNCNITSNCQRAFSTHIYETSTEDTTAARNISNYQQVRRVSPDVTTGAFRVNETVVIGFSTENSSFYFAIQDETSCIVITRIIVFYYVCPKQIVDLIIYPETLALSANQTTPLSVLVPASCVASAKPEIGLVPFVTCMSGGVWGLVPTAGCRSINASNETCECKQSPCHGIVITGSQWGLVLQACIISHKYRLMVGSMSTQTRAVGMITADKAHPTTY